MIAIVLCAGFATRLHPLTKETPNALLEVGGKSLLDHQMDRLLELPDLKEIHLVSNSRFMARFYNWKPAWKARLREHGVALLLHNDGSFSEHRRRGEVGDLAFVLELADASAGAVVLSGDTIYRFSLRPLWEQFRGSGRNYVTAFPESHPQVLQQRSVVDFDEETHGLRHVYEHPDEPPTHWVMPPLYFLQPAALGRVTAYLDEGGDPDHMGEFIDYVVTHDEVEVVVKNDRTLRLRINTRYMYEKANELLAEAPLLVVEPVA